MWMEEYSTSKGIRYRFSERYTNPLTGKLCKVSVSKDSKSNQAKKAAYEELQLMIKNKLDRRDSDILLTELIDDYIKSRVQYVKSNTIINMQMHRNRIVKFFGEDALFAAITPKLLQSFVDTMLSKNSRDYVRSTFGLIRRAVVYAARLDIIASADIISKVVIEAAPKTIEEIEKKRNKFLSASELKEVLALIREEHPLIADICEFQALTGLRYGELVSLRECDYNARTGEISVNATMYFARRKGDMPAIRTTPKNEYSVRRIALGDRAKEILEKFQQASYCLRMWQKANVTTYAEDGYIFINKVGNVYDRSFVNRVLRKIEYHKPISTHIFRHTHISLLAEENVPIKAIMARVGHNDPSTTLEIYTHATNDMKNQATEAINRITKRINA